MTKLEQSKERFICPICGQDLDIESHYKLNSLPECDSFNVLCPDPNCSFYHATIFVKTIQGLKYYPVNIMGEK